jgi:hypothetical protein
MEEGSMNLIITVEAEKKMVARGINKEDIQAVIKYAEEEKEFLIADDGNFLAKHRFNNFCPYVAYSKKDDDYTVNSVYAHTVQLGHEFK